MSSMCTQGGALKRFFANYRNYTQCICRNFFPINFKLIFLFFCNDLLLFVEYLIII